MSKKSGKGIKRPVQMNKELLSLLKHSQEIHRRWKQGQATWKEYREAVRVNKNETRKARALQEYGQGRQGQNTGLVQIHNNRRKTKDSVGLLLNGEGILVTGHREGSTEHLLCFGLH